MHDTLLCECLVTVVTCLLIAILTFNILFYYLFMLCEYLTNACYMFRLYYIFVNPGLY